MSLPVIFTYNIELPPNVSTPQPTTSSALTMPTPPTSLFTSSLPTLTRLLSLRLNWKLSSKPSYFTSPALHHAIKQQIELLSIAIPTMSISKLVETLALLIERKRLPIDSDINPQEEMDLLEKVLERVQYAFKVAAPETEYAEYLEALEGLALLGRHDERVQAITATMMERMVKKTEDSVWYNPPSPADIGTIRRMLGVPKEDEGYPKFENDIEKKLFEEKDSKRKAGPRKEVSSSSAKAGQVS